MTAQQQREDAVELLPLKSALVNNNYRDEEAYYPVNNNPTSSHEYTQLTKRAPASKRILARKDNASTPLVTLSGTPAPSRKREEQTALANLRKKVAPALLNDNRTSRINNNINNNEKTHTERNETEPLDNRPKLLQKVAEKYTTKSAADKSTSASSSAIVTFATASKYRRLNIQVLKTRPVSMVLQWSEVRTAWQDSDFITECLCWHNVYRQRHGVPELHMAPELCDYAQAWANHLAHTQKFCYRNDRDIGQNLYQKPVSNHQLDITGQEASAYWYAAARQYHYYKEPDVLHANVNAGHFTQIVWAATKYFGVGKARSRAGKVIVVANYSPPGNQPGQFEANVLPPLPDNFPDPTPPVQ